MSATPFELRLEALKLAQRMLPHPQTDLTEILNVARQLSEFVDGKKPKTEVKADSTESILSGSNMLEKFGVPAKPEVPRFAEFLETLMIGKAKPFKVDSWHWFYYDDLVNAGIMDRRKLVTVPRQIGGTTYLMAIAAYEAIYRNKTVVMTTAPSQMRHGRPHQWKQMYSEWRYQPKNATLHSVKESAQDRIIFKSVDDLRGISCDLLLADTAGSYIETDWNHLIRWSDARTGAPMVILGSPHRGSPFSKAVLNEMWCTNYWISWHQSSQLSYEAIMRARTNLSPDDFLQSYCGIHLPEDE